jgi:hypothetical protein
MKTPVRDARQDGPRELSFRDGTVMVTTARVLVVRVGHRSGPWAVRSLRDAGYGVHTSNPEAAPGGRSGIRRSPLRHPSPAASPEAFLGWLEDTCRAERISAVLALDEDAVRVIAQGEPRLSGAVFAGPTAAQHHALCDPVGLARTAAAAVVDHLATGREAIAGQRWVLHCVRGDGGLAMVAARVSSTYPRGAGASSVSQIVPTPPALGEVATRLLDRVDYRGPCCIDVVERDGRHAVTGVTLRLGASAGAAAAAGFDQPRWGVEAALGHFRPPVGIARSVTYLPLPSELAAFGDALRGRSDESAVAIARRIAHAAVARDHQLDPPLSDAARLASVTGRSLHRLLRRSPSQDPGATL